MSSVAEIGQAIQSVLSNVVDAAARETGFTQRASKLTGAKLAQTTVLGWLTRPAATLEELSQTAAAVGVPISAQGLDQRFTAEAAALLQQVLNAALGQIIAAALVAIPAVAAVQRGHRPRQFHHQSARCPGGLDPERWTGPSTAPVHRSSRRWTFSAAVVLLLALPQPGQLLAHDAGKPIVLLSWT
jgi:hypothetical protein